MRSRAAIWAVAIALLLLGITVLRHAQDTALAQSGGPDAVTEYAVEPGAASGGGYHLTSVSWRVSGTAAGGGYRLVEPSGVALRGSGCCCTYLPCVLRNVH